MDDATFDVQEYSYVHGAWLAAPNGLCWTLPFARMRLVQSFMDGKRARIRMSETTFREYMYSRETRGTDRDDPTSVEYIAPQLDTICAQNGCYRIIRSGCYCSAHNTHAWL